MERLEAAKDVLARYLAGDPLEPHRVDDAIRVLSALAPEELERMHLATLESACAAVGDLLAEYAALGDSAATVMPHVGAHLNRCDSCRKALDEVIEVRSAWVALADRLRPREESPVLVLMRSAWHWLWSARGALKALSAEDCGLGRRLGDWMLQPSQVVARGFSEAGPPIRLAMDLPRTASRVQVDVTPKYHSTAHRQEWNIRVGLLVGGDLQSVWVGLGDQARNRTGFRDVAHSRPAEFTMPVPSIERYWVHFDYRTVGGESVASAVELPLLGAVPES